MDTRRHSGQARQPCGAARGRLRPVDGQTAEALQPDDAVLLGGGLPRDAAPVLLTRRELDRLLVQLTTAPFSAAAYDGLRTYLAGPGRRAQAAYDRVCTSAPPAGR